MLEKVVGLTPRYQVCTCRTLWHRVVLPAAVGMFACKL